MTNPVFEDSPSAASIHVRYQDGLDFEFSPISNWGSAHKIYAAHHYAVGVPSFVPANVLYNHANTAPATSYLFHLSPKWE